MKYCIELGGPQMIKLQDSIEPKTLTVCETYVTRITKSVCVNRENPVNIISSIVT